MTTETEVRCPKCGKADSIDLSGSARLCLSCRNEWNPATDTYTEAEPATPSEWTAGVVGDVMAATTASEVMKLGRPVVEHDDDDTPDNVVYLDVEGTPNDWSDKFVRTDGGAVVLVLEDEGDGTLGVQTAAGLRYEIMRDTATFIGDDPMPDGDGIETLGIDEPMPQTILAVAGLCLTVALEAVTPSPDDEYHVGNPRIGWLPPPCDQVPEAECGVAYAAALLISVFGLDREQVAKLAANLLTGAESGTETETVQ